MSDEGTTSSSIRYTAGKHTIEVRPDLCLPCGVYSLTNLP